MPAPEGVAIKVEVISEPEPILAGANRGFSPRPSCRALHPHVAVRRWSGRLGQINPVANACHGFYEVWLPKSLLAVADGDLDGFGERVGFFVSRLIDSNSPVFKDAQHTSRSFGESEGK